MAHTLSLLNIHTGALACLKESQTVSLDAVGDDQDEELESYASALQIDEQLARLSFEGEPELPDADDLTARLQPTTEDEAVPSKVRKIEHVEMRANLKKASQNIVGSSTLGEYVR